MKSPAGQAIYIASEMHRLQNFPPALYGSACLAIHHSISYSVLFLFSLYINLLSSVAFSCFMLSDHLRQLYVCVCVCVSSVFLRVCVQNFTSNLLCLQEKMVPKQSQNGLKMIKNDPKIVPKWHHNGPKIVPKQSQMVPKQSQNGPKIVPNGPKIVPKWSQNGPKIVSKWSQQQIQG